MIWLLEDLHAADLQTLDLLVFLSQPVRSLPLLLLATARRHDPRIDARGGQRLARLAREGLDLELAPLGQADVAALAKQWLCRDLAAAELADLVSRAEGNPLFVVELSRAARMLDAGGRTTLLPATIRQLVLEGFGRLPEETRRALEAGAILGREFVAGDVARMSSMLPARVVDALAPALQAGLVVERSPGVFAFGHALERDAIEEALSATARAELHARAEAALRNAGDLPHVLLERARHALSGAPGDDAPVLALVERAMHELEARGAYDRAHALALRLEDARATRLVSTPASAEELLRTATIAQRAGQHAAHRRLCNEVTERARARGDGRLAAQAALVLGADIRPGIVDPELVAHLEEAQRMLGTGEVALTCRVEARLAAALQPAHDPMAVVAKARETISRARSLGDDALVADVLVTAGAAMVDYGPVKERVALGRELLERARRTGDREKMLRARARIAMDGLELGEPGALTSFYGEVDALLEVSLELGQARHRWRPLLFASMRACMLGNFDESDRLLVEVQQLSSLTDDPSLALSLAMHRRLKDALARITEADAELGAELQRALRTGTYCSFRP